MVAAGPVRYRSPDEDSARWLAFAFRPGDIVISTRSKSGTTWMQMICALLVFQTPQLPAPLWHLSPWLDWLVTPLDDVLAQLEAQPHRRFVKTHTPLDGLPLDDRATYVVVARHPLDMAVSLYHQGLNLDRDRMRELTKTEPDESPIQTAPAQRSVQDSLRQWIRAEADPRDELDSLPGVLHHLTDAWSRREQPNVVIVHYADLQADLEGEMRRVAARLDIDVPEPTWSSLVPAARFDEMRARADELAPDPVGVLKDRRQFFRQGASGAGSSLLASAEFDEYLERAASMAPPDLLAWLHRQDPAGG